MRGLAVACVAALALGACQKQGDEAAGTGKVAAAADPAAPTGPPKRRPGLWSHTIATSGMNQSMKICLDADTDAKMTVWGQAMGDKACAKNSFAPAPGGGWAFESDCDMGQAGRIVSKGTTTGDFNSAYVVQITSTTTNAAMAQANGTRDTTLSAKWEGACPADMKGGDVRLANGMTINMETMTAGR